MKSLFRLCLGALVGLAALFAHPMGNFSVNHYARIEVGQPETKVLFVLDLAELPSFELLQKWGLQGTSPRAELKSKAIVESQMWVRQLQFTANGKTIHPIWAGIDLVVSDGAGGLPVLRITTHLRLAAQPGTLHYLDGTYPDRTAGWKEVVVKAGTDVFVKSPSTASIDRSQALSYYPQDPTLSPPQDLTTNISWRGQTAVLSAAPTKAEPKPIKSEIPLSAPALPASVRGPTMPEGNSLGQVKRGDFLSTALQGKEVGWGLGLLCIAVAFWFGALHALEPGHGKTMVAAYLVGERGTPRHALMLGGMVTFTHTLSVFVLGALTMFLSRYVMADVLSKWLGIISGLTIVWIGTLLLFRRLRSLTMAPLRARNHGHPDSGGQERAHSHDGGRPHVHRRSRPHLHAHDASAHTHNGSTHSHAIEGDLSIKNLLALGVSGGLVPCPSALVLLLAAVSVGRIGLGLLLLVSFSIGLAVVLIATGLLVLYAKRFLPERKTPAWSPVAAILPIVSAAVITVIGLILTGNAAGVIPMLRFFG